MLQAQSYDITKKDKAKPRRGKTVDVQEQRKLRVVAATMLSKESRDAILDQKRGLPSAIHPFNTQPPQRSRLQEQHTDVADSDPSHPDYSDYLVRRAMDHMHG